MCPGCCPGIGMGVTPAMNTHKGTMGIAVPCSRREHRAILPEPSSFREPGALWANRTVETARLVYKSNRNATSSAMLAMLLNSPVLRRCKTTELTESAGVARLLIVYWFTGNS